MTTIWQPNGEWKGETVAILGAGPSMSEELAESLREHRCIVLNMVCQLAPWADMLMGLDGNWPQEMREFEGMRVTGTADDSLDALYIGHRWECVKLERGQVEIRNSGLAAVRIALGMGAARVILAGVEPERWPDASQWGTGAPDHPDLQQYYEASAKGLQALVAEARAAGVEIVRA